MSEAGSTTYELDLLHQRLQNLKEILKYNGGEFDSKTLKFCIDAMEGKTEPFDAKTMINSNFFSKEPQEPLSLYGQFDLDAVELISTENIQNEALDHIRLDFEDLELYLIMAKKRLAERVAEYDEAHKKY